MRVLNYEIFNIHAEFCKTLANPKRLIIIAALGKRDMTVSELAKLLDSSLASTSQHLKILKGRDIVSLRKEGQRTFYHLNDRDLVEATDRIREIVISLYRRKGEDLGGNTKGDKLIAE